MRCVNCLTPDTKPGIKLKKGICQACIRAEQKKDIDYDARFKELEKLCKKYRSTNGYYDCIIPISGGKDSHYQVYMLKEILKMNPLLVQVGDPFTKTRAGIHNLKNICERFKCDLISLNISPDLVRRMVRIAFDELGSPTWAIDRAIYCYPIRMAINFNIPLVVYGENVSWEYGGVQQEETYSAKDQINNDVAKKVDFLLWFKNGIHPNELNMIYYPTQKEIEKAKLEPIYLSYFVPWDGGHNYRVASYCGFKDLKDEWHREGFIEDYDQIDSIGYLMNIYMKYVKLGFGRATDVAGYWIRSGHITTEEGKRLIEENDHKLDPRVLNDFLDFTEYTEKEFWQIVEKWRRKD